MWTYVNPWYVLQHENGSIKLPSQVEYELFDVKEEWKIFSQ